MNTADQGEFPRTVYDELGRYTIETTGAYKVESSTIERLAAITYMRRDLERAYEMIVACCSDELDDLDSLIEQSLWIGAIVIKHLLLYEDKHPHQQYIGARIEPDTNAKSCA